MEQHNQLTTQQSNYEQLSQKANDLLQPGVDTIDGCTMDPCPMKEKNKSEHHGKCPDCGKTENVKRRKRIEWLRKKEL